MIPASYDDLTRVAQSIWEAIVGTGYSTPELMAQGIADYLNDRYDITYNGEPT